MFTYVYRGRAVKNRMGGDLGRGIEPRIAARCWRVNTEQEARAPLREFVDLVEDLGI